MIDYVEAEPSSLNFQQRWASYLTIFVAFVVFGIGIALKNRIENATTGYENVQQGITARYPTNWLLEENSIAAGTISAGPTNLVFRVQDPAAVPFKTAIEVSLAPSADIPNLLNLLNVTRAASLSSYRTLTITPITLRQNKSGTQMDYAFVASENNPFLETVPIVVRARDVIILRGNQAVIITYRADSDSFEKNLHYFDSFLLNVEF